MTVLKYTLYGPIQSGCSLLHRYAENCVLTNLNEFFLRDLEVMRHHSGIIYKARATGLAAIDLLSGVRIASTLPARMFNVLKASFCKSIRAMAFRAYCRFGPSKLIIQIRHVINDTDDAILLGMALQKSWGRSQKLWGRLWGRWPVNFGGHFGGEALK